MASVSVAVAPRPRPRATYRSGLSDSSNTQESGSSSAFESARESNPPTGYRSVPTIALSTPPVVPTLEHPRKSVAFEHRQGRQALDLTRDKPLPDIPASPTLQPVRRCWLLCLGRSWLIPFLHTDADAGHAAPSALSFSVFVLGRLIQRLCQIRTIGTLRKTKTSQFDHRHTPTPALPFHTFSPPPPLLAHPTTTTRSDQISIHAPTRRRRQPPKVFQGNRCQKPRTCQIVRRKLGQSRNGTSTQRLLPC